MKKVIICSVPMKKDIEKTVYESNDLSIPASSDPYVYPVNSFLAETLNADDEITVILLVKRDDNEYYLANTEVYKTELDSVCDTVGVRPAYRIIDTAFSEDKDTHARLMNLIIDAIENESHIIADITYGPKDLPIVVFSTLFFAENYLRCFIDNILYGQATFIDGKPVNTRICDMTSLYYLSSISNTINCNDPEKARQMIKNLLSI